MTTVQASTETTETSTPLADRLAALLKIQDILDNTWVTIRPCEDLTNDYGETLLGIEADISGAGEQPESVDYSARWDREHVARFVRENSELWSELWDKACGANELDMGDAIEAARKALADSDEPREWILREDGEGYDTITACNAKEALEEARDNVDRSNYADCKGALWIDVDVRCAETGEEAQAEVVLDEEEPDCEDGGEHDWQSPYSIVGGIKENPGVWGKGGGTLSKEVCMRCGCGRHTDTWAQRPDNGVQGYTVVTYEPGEFSDQVSELLDAQAREKGAEDGVEDVETVLAEQGREVVVATLSPHHLDWDEAAINAGAHRIVGIPDSHADAYYAAYSKAARERAEEIAEEEDD